VIPQAYITAWRAEAPWIEDFQVEQDLVISRALVEIFRHPVLAEALAFRGGTALYKLFLRPPARYSEDIDLVQTQAGAAGPLMEAIRGILDPWLGKPQWKQSEGRITFSYRVNSEGVPPIRLRLKIEINTREHFTVFGLEKRVFAVDSPWFRGSSEICTYSADELLGTKMRALYQRKKGRDLFDLTLALNQNLVNPQRVLDAFIEYLAREGTQVTRALFEENLYAKLADPRFTADIGPLLRTDISWDLKAAAECVLKELICRLPGDPWKLSDKGTGH
jgi:predicted nucleotidyltransferase component of viral defense system